MLIVNITKCVPQKCQKYQICLYQTCVLWSSNSTKTRFRPGLCPGPRAVELTPPPQPRLRRWYPFPIISPLTPKSMLRSTDSTPNKISCYAIAVH